MRPGAISGIAVALLLSAVPMVAQSLGEIAKQEAERRKAIGTPGKVYTNDSLRPETPPAPAQPTTPPAQPATPAAPASPAAQAPAGQAAGTGAPAEEPAPMTEEAWRKRMTDTRDALSRSQIFAEALQSRINALTTDFVNRDDPVQRDSIAAERQKALAELERVKKEIADHQKAIVTIQEEARRAGVPAGWVR